jgi:hypothetical protein
MTDNGVLRYYGQRGGKRREENGFKSGTVVIGEIEVVALWSQGGGKA